MPGRQRNPQLRVHMLGSFAVYHDATAIPDSAWKTDKNRALCKILLTFRHRVLTNDQLMDWLWPDLDPHSASRNLRVAVSQVRRVLEPELSRGSESCYVLHTPIGYAWNTQAECWLDVAEFEARCATFEREAHEDALAVQMTVAEQAIAFYRGDYLEGDRYADWAMAKRERLRERYFALLTLLAEVYARQGRYRRAVALCREILAADRCRESVWCQLMLYHYHAGDQALAARAYEDCRQVLDEELQVAPLAETATLAEQIRRRTVSGGRSYPPPAAVERLRRLPLSLGSIPFVDREAEYAAVIDHLQQAFAGRGRVVLIEAEAGLGKTRLAHEILEEARRQGALILEGRGHELTAAMPFQPLIDALRSHQASCAGALDRLSPVWRLELAHLLPEWRPPDAEMPWAGPDPDPGRLFEALTRYLFTLIEEPHGPPAVLLFVDDLHWTDPMTVAFLAYFGQRLAGRPILLLITARPEEIVPASHLATLLKQSGDRKLVHRITLPPLDREATIDLVRQLSRGGQGAARLGHRLYQETLGYPLYVIALIQSWFEDGLCHLDPQGGWQFDEGYVHQDDVAWSVPPQVGDLVRHRIERLDARSQRLLALAAVIGRPFDFDLLRQVSGVEEEVLLDTLDQVLERRLLQPIDGPARHYVISHDLIRRAVYQTLSPERRALHHRKVLMALEAGLSDAIDSRLGELAHHAIQGRVWPRALEYCLHAATVALDRYAAAEALRHCERGLMALEALEANGDAPDPHYGLVWRYDFLAARQLAEHLLGQRDLPLANQLVDLADQIGDPERLAQAHYALMRHLIDTGQNQAALDLVPRYATVIAEGVAPATAIGFHQRVGFLHYRTGKLDRALHHHDEALRLAHAVPNDHQQAVVLNTRGTVLMCLGRYPEALDDFTRAAELWDTPTRRLFRTFALDNRADVLYYLGCYADALRTKEKALPVYREFAYPIAEAECLAEMGHLLRAMGHADEAAARLRDALALSESLGDRYNLVQSLNGLALLDLEQENPAAWSPALDYAARAVTEAEQAHLPHGLIHGLTNQALAWLRLGQPAKALEYSSRALTLLEAEGQIEGAEEEVYFMASRVLTADGQQAAARVVLDRAYEAMMAKAERLSDPDLRRSFLQRVAVNRAIQAALGLSATAAQPLRFNTDSTSIG